ncbi:hypothetical protein LCGC14_1709740 [marine sediment metagenome]|uniref:Uncharacterized protein n=2 Tax=marine sediment metagenome TaxID=412755 RepID=A0A0F9I352_9ZZZZ
MANQRFYLRHLKTGAEVMLFKRFGVEYEALDSLPKSMDAFLNRVNEDQFPLDEFELVLEMPKGFGLIEQ